MSTYIEITNENIEEVIKDGIVLLDFWATWCGPCRMLSPVIDQLAIDFDGKAKICKVNSDDQQDLTVKYGVRSVPTILFLKNGEIVGQMIGSSANKQTITEKLNSLL
jgi:thioredoxin 1